MATASKETTPSRGQRRTNQGLSLMEIKTLAQRDQGFAHALKACHTPQEAVHVARRRGIAVSPEALWRQRGTLLPGGQPTWRG